MAADHVGLTTDEMLNAIAALVDIDRGHVDRLHNNRSFACLTAAKLKPILSYFQEMGYPVRPTGAKAKLVEQVQGVLSGTLPVPAHNAYVYQDLQPRPRPTPAVVPSAVSVTTTPALTATTTPMTAARTLVVPSIPPALTSTPTSAPVTAAKPHSTASGSGFGSAPVRPVFGIFHQFPGNSASALTAEETAIMHELINNYGFETKECIGSLIACRRKEGAGELTADELMMYMLEQREKKQQQQREREQNGGVMTSEDSFEERLYREEIKLHDRIILESEKEKDVILHRKRSREQLLTLGEDEECGLLIAPEMKYSCLLHPEDYVVGGCTVGSLSKNIDTHYVLQMARYLDSTDGGAKKRQQTSSSSSSSSANINSSRNGAGPHCTCSGDSTMNSSGNGAGPQCVITSSLRPVVVSMILTECKAMQWYGITAPLTGNGCIAYIHLLNERIDLAARNYTSGSIYKPNYERMMDNSTDSAGAVSRADRSHSIVSNCSSSDDEILMKPTPYQSILPSNSCEFCVYMEGILANETTELQKILYQMPEYAGAVPKEFRSLIRRVGSNGELTTSCEGTGSCNGADFELEADGFEVVE